MQRCSGKGACLFVCGVQLSSPTVFILDVVGLASLSVIFRHDVNSVSMCLFRHDAKLYSLSVLFVYAKLLNPNMFI
jgi:hypothetical protein